MPYTTMTRLPGGTSPADGFVRVTSCPTRVCLPTTLNPSPTSSSRALVKVIPTTSGTGTRGGALEAGGLAGRLAEGLPGGGTAVEATGDAGRELAGVTAGGDPEATAAVECRVAPAAEVDLDADPAAGTGVAAA